MLRVTKYLFLMLGVLTEKIIQLILNVAFDCLCPLETKKQTTTCTRTNLIQNALHFITYLPSFHLTDLIINILKYIKYRVFLYERWLKEAESVQLQGNEDFEKQN